MGPFNRFAALLALVSLVVTLGICQEDDVGGDSTTTTTTSLATSPASPSTPRMTMSFFRELKNVTKEAGDFLRLRCEVVGDVAAR